MRRLVFALIAFCLIVGFVSAVPTTGAVTGLSNRQATFSATGGSGSGWFEWGIFSGGPYYWSTPNQTVSGAFTDTQYGPPMMTSTTYYVRACDSTGCGGDVSFSVPSATMVNITSFGTGVITIWRSGFNVSQTLPVIIAPYQNTIGAPLTWGLLFFFIFAGLWLRPKDIFLPCVLAMVAGGAIWLGPNALGVPAEFADVGQGLMYAAVAGICVSWFTK